MEQSLPLAGLKVVELATVVAGPAAARILAGYGAEVIKIETPVKGDLLPACTGLAVVAVRVNRNTAARGKFAPDLNVFRIHKADKVFHDDVHTVLVEIAVIAEAEQIQFE